MAEVAARISSASKSPAAAAAAAGGKDAAEKAGGSNVDKARGGVTRAKEEEVGRGRTRDCGGKVFLATGSGSTEKGGVGGIPKDGGGGRATNWGETGAGGEVVPGGRGGGGSSAVVEGARKGNVGAKGVKPGITVCVPARRKGKNANASSGSGQGSVRAGRGRVGRGWVGG